MDGLPLNRTAFPAEPKNSLEKLTSGESAQKLSCRILEHTGTVVIRAYLHRGSKRLWVHTDGEPFVEGGDDQKRQKRAGDQATGHHGGQGMAIAYRLAHRDDVGNDAGVLETPHMVAQTAQAGLNFIRN